MREYRASKSLRIFRASLPTALVGVLGLVALVTDAPGQSSTEYRELITRIPRAANMAMIFNVEKIVKSPLGVRQGWTRASRKPLTTACRACRRSRKGLFWRRR